MESSPGAYKKVTAMLDEAARARLLDASPSSAPPGRADADDDLMDLVDEFYNGYDPQGADAGAAAKDSASPPRSSERKEKLLAILADAAADAAASWIRAVAERAVRDAAPANASGVGVRKRVVERLRANGFNAGLCRSSWEKSSSIPAPGAYEYVDVIMGSSPSSSRYIVEVNIASEFDIARPSAEYRDLLQSLPPVLVARPEAIDQVGAAMCAAAADSIRGAGMHLAPWRRERYVQAKWSAQYERVAVTPLATAGARREAVTPVATARRAAPPAAAPGARREAVTPVATARRAAPPAAAPGAPPSKQQAGVRAVVHPRRRPGGQNNCGMEMGRAMGREPLMNVRPLFRGM